jgi:restriction system protein
VEGSLDVAKRGFIAEMAYQSQQAEKRKRQQAVSQQRQRERDIKQHERATAQQEKEAAKEAKQAYLDFKIAEVDSMNDDLSRQVLEIEYLLESAMRVDSWIDLESFRVVAEHPPIETNGLHLPIPAPVPVQAPPEPVYMEPAAPSSLGGLFGGKKRHEQLLVEAQATHQEALARWQSYLAAVPEMQLQQMQQHQAAEAERQEKYANLTEAYDAECAAREAEIAGSNIQLDALIAGVQAGTKEGIEEYVTLVLEHSGYPEDFPVEHDVAFDPVTREITLVVSIAGPEQLPTVREYKYNKSKDEITSTAQTQKALKDLYASALNQITLRALHEVFEADRAKLIQTISMSVGFTAIDPATGNPEDTKLLMVAADRGTYETFDLTNVVPTATLEHLGAVVSKNPFGRVAIDDSRGVRGSK